MSAQTSAAVVPLYELCPRGEIFPSETHFELTFEFRSDAGRDDEDRRDCFPEFRNAGDVSLELAFEFSDPLFVLNVLISLLCVLESEICVNKIIRKIINFAIKLFCNVFWSQILVIQAKIVNDFVL